MEARKPVAPELPMLIENLHAPELFVTWTKSIVFGPGNNAHFTFVTMRSDHASGKQAEVVTGRLIMPIEAATNLAQFLASRLQQLQLAATPPAPDQKAH
jgi:C4-dicarboxylate transporter